MSKEARVNLHPKITLPQMIKNIPATVAISTLTGTLGGAASSKNGMADIASNMTSTIMMIPEQTSTTGAKATRELSRVVFQMILW